MAARASAAGVVEAYPIYADVDEAEKERRQDSRLLKPAPYGTSNSSTMIVMMETVPPFPPRYCF